MKKINLSLIASAFVLTQIYASDVKLEGVEVTESADDGYREKTSEVGKTTTPIIETPQMVNVVTAQQLKDKKPETLAESLQNVSG
jgi:tonB-dependent siderophore receptor